MSVAAVVLAMVLIAGLSFWFESGHHTGDHLADPADSERWLVRTLARWPRLARFLHRRLDRTTGAGVLVTAAFAIVLGAALVVGFLSDLADNRNGLAGADRWVASWGSRQATDLSTDVLLWITDLGSTAVGFVALAIAAAVDFRRNRNSHVFSYAVLLVAGQWLLVNGLKVLVRRDRPDLLQLADATGYSFPSGHSATSAACWAGVAFVLARRSEQGLRLFAGTLAVLIAVGVASSRALLGVHWLSDVVAGSFIGWAWASLLILVFSRELRPLAHLARRVAAGADTGGVQ